MGMKQIVYPSGKRVCLPDGLEPGFVLAVGQRLWPGWLLLYDGPLF